MTIPSIYLGTRETDYLDYIPGLIDFEGNTVLKCISVTIPMLGGITHTPKSIGLCRPLIIVMSNNGLISINIGDMARRFLKDSSLILFNLKYHSVATSVKGGGKIYQLVRRDHRRAQRLTFILNNDSQGNIMLSWVPASESAKDRIIFNKQIINIPSLKNKITILTRLEKKMFLAKQRETKQAKKNN